MRPTDFAAAKAQRQIADARADTSASPAPSPARTWIGEIFHGWRERARELGLSKSETLAYKMGAARAGGRNLVVGLVCGIVIGLAIAIVVPVSDAIQQQWAFERGRASAIEDANRDPASGLVARPAGER